MDFNRSFVSMSAIAHINKGMFRSTGNSAYLFQRIFQRVPVIGIAVKRHGTNKPSAFAGSRHDVGIAEDD